jgi:MFS superfamily sulfate permease-like transporter
MAGAILIVAALARLGFVADFISEPVWIGFKAGIGLVIVLDQVPKRLGIHFEHGPFFRNIFRIFENIPHASLVTVAVAAAMISILLAVEHFFPRAPGPLIAVAGGIAAMKLLGLQAYGVRTVGQVPTGLPSLCLPDLSLAADLWPAATGMLKIFQNDEDEPIGCRPATNRQALRQCTSKGRTQRP